MCGRESERLATIHDITTQAGGEFDDTLLGFLLSYGIIIERAAYAGEIGIIETIVIITHEMAVIRQICNRVTIIDGGKIVEEGTVDEVFTHTKSAAGRRLFGVIKEDDDQTIHEAVRVVFDGSTCNDPVLSDFIMKTGMPVNILSADVRRLGGKPYGQMLLALPESYADREKLIHGLREMGLTAEEVHS